MLSFGIRATLESLGLLAQLHTGELKCLCVCALENRAIGPIGQPPGKWPGYLHTARLTTPDGSKRQGQTQPVAPLIAQLAQGHSRHDICGLMLVTNV